MQAAQLLFGGRGLVESPRWHDGQFWFADWTAGEILRINDRGRPEVQGRVDGLPLCFDFAHDGALLIVAARAGRLLRQDAGGRQTNLATLGPGAWNEIVVDGRGNAYVNGPALVLVTPDGQTSAEADDFAFPNGMAVTPDNTTLIIAESHAKRLSALRIGRDGHLSGRRVWAELDGPPDGICIDANGAVWYADVPNRRCRRVREGGEVLDEVRLDRGAFACMLGGLSRQTLLITAAKWYGMEGMAEMAGTGQVLTAAAPVAGAGWP